MVRRFASFPHALFALIFAGVVVFAVTGEMAVRKGAEIVAVAALVVNAATRKDSRTAWWLLAGANVAWLAGDLGVELNPFYLASYAFAHAGLVLLVAVQARAHWRTWLALDGILAGLTAAAILTGFVSTALTGPGVTVPMTMLGGDAVLVTTVVVAFAVNGWRPGRVWWVLALAEVFIVTADLSVVGREGPTHAATVAWAIGLVLSSYAAFHPSAKAPARSTGVVAASVSIAGGAISVGLLMHAGLTGGSALTIWLSGSAIVVGLVRTMLLITDNQRLLRRTRVDARTDKLTGLPNRRALERDLDQAFATGRPHTLAFFDLDGFKEYNDAFGHGAGDALLQRLAPALGGYRLGGDEFCLLLPGALSDDTPAIQRGIEALSEHGDGFSITASYGLVVLPDEARDAADALKRADERMYARKRRRRGGQGGQAREVLIQVLAERGTRDDGVAQLVAEVGRRLDLTAEEIDVLVRAAELRDVGLVAIPDGTTPDEPLYRQHPVAGERILAVAESMRPVARLVRSTHERFDGTGYPDGLEGEEIPLGARIIAACVAEGRADDGALDPRVASAVACARSAAREPARSPSSPAGSARRS